MTSRSDQPAPVVPFGEPLVDAATVAAYFGVDPTTVYRLASAGEIPSIEVARRTLRFRPEDVRAFIDQRTRSRSRKGRVQRLLEPRR